MVLSRRSGGQQLPHSQQLLLDQMAAWPPHRLAWTAHCAHSCCQAFCSCGKCARSLRCLAVPALLVAGCSQGARLAPHYLYANFTAQYRAACALRAVGRELAPEEMMMFTTGERVAHGPHRPRLPAHMLANYVSVHRPRRPHSPTSIRPGLVAKPR